METKEMRLLRAMAWERAKGELKSMLHSYYNASPGGDDNFEKMNSLTKEFIVRVEENGLHE